MFSDEIDRDVSIVYTPLNGTGLIPVTKLLSESGFTHVTLVEEQRLPDGNFPTCPYPNPEIREAMELGLEYCRKTGADLLIATDPDCDRCGIAVRSLPATSASASAVWNTARDAAWNTAGKTPIKENDDSGAAEEGEYELLTGNELGCLLLDYICSQRQKHGKMPPNPVLIKTIVTTPLAEKIATNYNVETINVLTGFKYIGEQITLLEQQGRAADYLLGFEESYGYLTGTYVRDKDGVNAVFMIAEMFAFYKTNGISLLAKLEELYQKYGYYQELLLSYEFPGSEGMEKMNTIMAEFRSSFSSSFSDGKGDSSFGSFAGMAITSLEDYALGIHGLPKSNVLKFTLQSPVEAPVEASMGDAGDAGESIVFIRPSGTEPQLKAYISTVAKDKASALETAEKIKHSLDEKIKS